MDVLYTIILDAMALRISINQRLRLLRHVFFREKLLLNEFLIDFDWSMCCFRCLYDAGSTTYCDDRKTLINTFDIGPINVCIFTIAYNKMWSKYDCFSHYVFFSFFVVCKYVLPSSCANHNNSIPLQIFFFFF